MASTTTEGATLIDPIDGLIDIESYTGANIRVLEGIQAIQMRPAMYIGGTDLKGLHHLVYEVIDNAIDEAMAGYGRDIQVAIHADGSISVTDEGRGIPVDIHQESGKGALEIVLTKVHAGGKFDHNSYKVSGGLHGVGVTAVNALSEWLAAEVRRDGKVWRQEFERGEPKGPVKAIGTAKTTGTKITFLPDANIFPNITFDYDYLEKRLRELSFLNSGVRISLDDERGDEPKHSEFYSDKGIAEFVQYLNRAQSPIHAPVVLTSRDEEKNIGVEVALQYTDAYTENVLSYCNNIHTIEGGTHLTGFRAGLTRTLNAYAKAHAPQTKKDLAITGEDFKEGLTAIVSVKVPDPQFESQTKIKLTNADVEGIVTKAVNDKLAEFLERNPKSAKDIIAKASKAAEAREAARKARELVRVGVLSKGGGLPGKLMDCTTSDQGSSELFLVEGDSAGGTAEGGRDRMYQAILPLRGKILNVERARADKVLGNEEVRNIIMAVGGGIGDDNDPSKRRYGKVVLMSDADVDGAHIRTLLMTFFYRQMPKLVAEGHLYVAQPPLYMITHKKDRRYVQAESEMQAILVELGMADLALYRVGHEEEPGYSGARLKVLYDIVNGLIQGRAAFGKRNLDFKDFLKLAIPALDPRAELRGMLPLYHASASSQEAWLYTQGELEAYNQAHPAPDEASPEAEPETTPPRIVEMHEVRILNKWLTRLRDEFGWYADFLVPDARMGDEPVPRFGLQRDGVAKGSPIDGVIPLLGLLELVPRVRELGEKGLKITRFKGLGEMDADQLWDTTMDPTRRTLMQVRLDDAASANDLFTTLMGDEVAPRREFIEKHALEVKNLDV